MFSVSIGNKKISSNSKRSQKLWKIFKYIITFRNKMIPAETLIEMLWQDNQPENPQNALQLLISRLRKLMSKSGATGEYILFQHDSYQWNTELPINFDIDEFERLYKLAESVSTDAEKLSYLKKAVDLYAGDYLAESAYELWLLPVTIYFKRQYVYCVTKLADIYSRASAQDEIIRLCNTSIRIQPYEEEIFERYIRALILKGRISEAERLYYRFTELIQMEFGAQPSEELRLLCQGMGISLNEQLDISGIKQRLDKESMPRGVFFCTVDVFDQIYQLDKRSDERMKFPVFLGLITLNTANGKPPGGKHLKNAMFTLRQCLGKTLRNGDIVAQYSKNQYVLLLSAYLPEHAETALKRIELLYENEYKEGIYVMQINFSKIGK